MEKTFWQELVEKMDKAGISPEASVVITARDGSLTIVQVEHGLTFSVFVWDNDPKQPMELKYSQEL